LKSEAVRGLNETEALEPDIEDKYKVPKPLMPERVGTRYNEDKTAQRTGWILEEGVTETIWKGVKEAKEYLSNERTIAKKVTTAKDLFDLLDILKAGVMIGYPAYHGLPEWEPCMVFLESKEDLLQKDEPNLEVTIILLIALLLVL